MRSPPDPETYNNLVWTIVKQIPQGIVTTYGQIASMIPPPDEVTPPVYDRYSAQWVGSAMNATPPGEGIPWQRVINSRGMISLPEGSPGALKQRELLEAEGVVFNDAGRVDFEIYGWDGPPEEFRREYGLFTPRPLRKSPPGSNQQMKLL